ncbi:unnamed protein product [Orchesella dallaii]|uniref:Peptidase aspartic putative domain-containing protein n=1 Tax=Orchesella dallaii TaxID=48710 RepID=A0ABP1PTP5_9HEXA
MEIIKYEMQGEQQILLAQSTFTTGGPADGRKSGKQKKDHQTKETPTAAGLVATTQRNGWTGGPSQSKSFDRFWKSKKLHKELYGITSKKIGGECFRNIVFGGGSTKLRKVFKISVTLYDIRGSAIKRLQFLEKDDTCGMTPNVSTGKRMEEHRVQGNILSDIGADWAEVDILIGFDYWGDILTGHMKKLSPGVMASETIFGWSLRDMVSMDMRKQQPQ